MRLDHLANLRQTVVVNFLRQIVEDIRFKGRLDPFWDSVKGPKWMVAPHQKKYKFSVKSFLYMKSQTHCIRF